MWRPLASLLLSLTATLWGAAGSPEAWVPARWQVTAPLDLLEGTPINCLLVPWGGGEDAVRVKAFAQQAHERGIAVLGVGQPGADVSKLAAAGLDGLVIEGESGGAAGVTIPIYRDAALARRAVGRIVAVQGVRPGARSLTDMGIRAGPSAEFWIDSNIWLVRSFRRGTSWHPVWINHEPKGASWSDYIRCAAEAAVAGGRWIVALDDKSQASLVRKDPDALAGWQSLATYLKFAEEHADWRGFAPYGNVGIILDPASPRPEISNEYLNLIARRQVPYRVLLRSELGAASLAGLRAVVAADLDRPNEAERKILRAFEEQGGLVVAGPWRGDSPDPETDARDLAERLSPEEIGVTAFNVPSVLTYTSTSDSGKRMLVQLLNYSRFPAEAITIRVNGSFKAARLHSPGNAPVDLPVNKAGNRTEVAIRELAVWAGVLLEQ